ncbi:MAG: GSCFA domain-containing protein [Granulosicoccus sp.]
MSLNPYQNLPDTRFWSSGVKSPVKTQNLLAVDPLLTLLSANDSVVSGGSCFAQYIGKELSSRNYNYLKSGLAGDRIESFGLGNIYSIAQLKQWLDYSLGLRTWDASSAYQDNDQWFDLLLPHRSAMPSRARLNEHRVAVRDELLNHLTNSSVFIFTIGLTETWRNIKGDIYPSCPGTIVGEFDESNHIFHNCTFDEIHSDLLAVENLLEEINPEITVIYTVSPVPLTATATDNHVLLATTYSKSVIRAALGQYCAASTRASYFPSYELINHHTETDWRFDNNLRSISNSGVRYVMGHAFAEATRISDPGEENANALPDSDDGQEAICEEELLDSYSRLNSQGLLDTDILLIGDSHMGKLASGFEAAKIEVFGGMVMNGGSFSDGKFELSDSKIFLPMENSESQEIWSTIFDKLKSQNDACRIITNIGFQTHRTINRISNYFSTPVLTEKDIAEYFDQHFGEQINILRGLTKYGKVWLVEDPNFYAFIAGKDTAMTIRDRNFHQYCNHMRKIALDLDIAYLNPCDLVLQNQFKDAHSLSDMVASDGFHGMQSYYDYSAIAINALISGRR